jgi:2-deoxy-D-gluconate 3-dehydrogenase
MQDPLQRFRIEGKRALVTGGSKGIGAETAAVLAQAGADVAIVGRDRAGLQTTAAAVAAAGRQCVVIEADMATIEGPQAAAAAALAAFGTVDILVNNAGISRLDPLQTLAPAAWDETMAVNLRAPYLLAQALVGKMMAQGRGKIVNVSSQAGVIALETHGAYCASKGGLNMLTKVMAVEWGPHNILVNAV